MPLDMPLLVIKTQFKEGHITENNSIPISEIPVRMGPSQEEPCLSVFTDLGSVDPFL